MDGINWSERILRTHRNHYWHYRRHAQWPRGTTPRADRVCVRVDDPTAHLRAMIADWRTRIDQLADHLESAQRDLEDLRQQRGGWEPERQCRGPFAVSRSVPDRVYWDAHYPVVRHCVHGYCAWPVSDAL